MICAVVLISILVFELGFSFPQRNDENQLPGIDFHQDLGIWESEYGSYPKILIREPRQAPRKSLKKKYIPFVDGKPILIPATDPEKRENHVYDAEAEKKFLQSYLFPQTLDAPNEKVPKHSKGDLKKTVEIKKVDSKEKDYDKDLLQGNEYVVGSKSTIKRKPKHKKISTKKPFSEPVKYKDEHKSKTYEKISGSSTSRDNGQNQDAKEPQLNVENTNSDEYEYDSPEVIGSVTREKSDTGHPQQADYEYDVPVVVDRLTKIVEDKLKPKEEHKPMDYDKPVVIESIKKKPNIIIVTKDDGYDSPIVIEALTKKEPSKVTQYSDTVKIENVKKNSKVKPKNEVHKYKELSEQPIKITSEDEYDKLTISEAFPKKTETKGSEYGESEVYTSPAKDTHSVKDKEHFMPLSTEKKTTKTKDEYIEVNSNIKGTESDKVFTEGVPKLTMTTVKDKTNYKQADKLKTTKTSVYKDKSHVEDKHKVEPLGGRAIETETRQSELNEPSIELVTAHANLDFLDDANDEEQNSEVVVGKGVSVATSSSRQFMPVDSNVWSFLASIQSQERSKFKTCTTAKNQAGNCMPMQLCSAPNTVSTVDELVSNVCVIDEVFVGICCPEFPAETVNVQWEGLPLTHEKEQIAEKNPSGCGSLPESIDTGNFWPWMVTLVTTSHEVFCGGILLSDTVVLAAAHCTRRIPLNQILVRVRSLESALPFEDVEVVEIKRHAQYNPKTMINDLALLKLARRLKSTKASPICLPDSKLDYVGDEGILLGWKAGLGDTSDVEWLPIIPKNDCQRRLGITITESILCSEPRAEESACNADSGAPLVMNQNGKFVLIGVLTWNRHECDGMQPAVFTRISSFQKWIEKHSSVN